MPETQSKTIPAKVQLNSMLLNDADLYSCSTLPVPIGVIDMSLQV